MANMIGKNVNHFSKLKKKNTKSVNILFQKQLAILLKKQLQAENKRNSLHRRDINSSFIDKHRTNASHSQNKAQLFLAQAIQLCIAWHS